ncbi:hypothetical protein C8A01DRAFT_19748 [Parachaetomium inaequale]|uniref:Uncharacterized protein n=1 Tax=Parachaetomium inaequale TaxID=2588326 RepID=A0AAN6P9H7_9PEZI|nr:hypothetical protein C8A01DRAFT_19748 [Parachaetomium inaequale]
MDIRTLAFRAPEGKPLLWKRPVCDCHWFYQFYLCGCPDQTTPGEGGRTEHQLSYAGCPIWHMPKVEQAVQLRNGFRHNPNPPVRLEPSILPFPCYRHLMESRAFLSPAELHAARKRLMDPRWNPAGAARVNGNIRKLQLFQQEGRTWEAKKRVREEEDDGLPPPPPRRRRMQPQRPILNPPSTQPPVRSRNHYTTLTWLLDEQSTDLWHLDGYRSHLPPLKDRQTKEEAEKTKKKREKDRLVLDASYDGPTHTGYFGGAYKIDAEVLHQARIANWHPPGGQSGLDLARAVGDLWAGWVARGGWWLGGRLTM